MDRPVPPPCCLWVVRLSCLTAVGLDPSCPGGPLSAPVPGGPLAPFLSCLTRCLVDDPGRPCDLSPLGGPVEELAHHLWI